MNINIEVKLRNISYDVTTRILKLTFVGSNNTIEDAIDYRSQNSIHISRKINNAIVDFNDNILNKQEFQCYMKQIDKDLQPLISNYLSVNS